MSRLKNAPSEQSRSFCIGVKREEDYLGILNLLNLGLPIPKHRVAANRKCLKKWERLEPSGTNDSNQTLYSKTKQQMPTKVKNEGSIRPELISSATLWIASSLADLGLLA